MIKTFKIKKASNLTFSSTVINKKIRIYYFTEIIFYILKETYKLKSVAIKTGYTAHLICFKLNSIAKIEDLFLF